MLAYLTKSHRRVLIRIYLTLNQHLELHRSSEAKSVPNRNHGFQFHSQKSDDRQIRRRSLLPIVLSRLQSIPSSSTEGALTPWAFHAAHHAHGSALHGTAALAQSLEHLAHLRILLQQLVDLLNCRAGAVGYALAAGA